MIKSSFLAIFSTAALLIVPLSQAAEEGLLAYWSFDEGEGMSTRDVAGNDRMAVFRQGEPQWTDGRFENALEFDGDDDLTVTDWYGVSGNGARTVAFWVKTDWIVDAAGGIVGWGAAAPAGTKWHSRLNHAAGQGVVGAIRLELAGGRFVGTTPINDGEWHHIAVLLPEGGKVIRDVRHYVDGMLESASAIANETVEIATADESSGTEVTIGSRLQAVGDHFFVGAIDEVAIWDRALTEEEISMQASGQRVLESSPMTPEIPFVVTAVERNSEQVRLTWDATAELTYRVEYSPSLKDGSWEAIASSLGTGTFEDTSETRTAQTTGFYRVAVE